MINRRSFGKVAGVGAVGTSLIGWGANSAAAASAAPSGMRTSGSPNAGRGHTSFGRCGRSRRVSSHRLCRGGPRPRPPVILLHGWPYDIHSYVDVAPLLAARDIG